jgi:hypothetical protein
MKPQPLHKYRVTFTELKTVHPVKTMFPAPDDPTKPGMTTISRDPHLGQIFLVFILLYFYKSFCSI